MSAILVDTNVLVYAYDPTDGAKRSQAGAVLRKMMAEDTAVLSAQILGEFFVTVTRKIPSPLTVLEAQERITNYLSSAPVYNVTPLIVLEAVRGVHRYQLHYYDALIWATARLNQIPDVLTEDAEHGRILEGIRYLNPFHPEFEMSLLEV